MVDPGPNVEEHIRALSVALSSAEEASVLLTHFHSDHAGAAPALVRETGATLFGPPGYESGGDVQVEAQPLSEGDLIPTDKGDLVVLEIPGHAREHLGFHWIQADAVFVGDLLLGRGKTTWVGEYLGCVGDYLSSLDKIQALGASVLYPTHGPPITSPARVLERFRRHRLARLDEVRSARQAHPGEGPERLAELIYGGEIPPKLLKAARAAVEAALFHLDMKESPN